MATANLTFSMTDVMETTTILQHGSQCLVVRKQVDAMLPHLPPALRVLDHDWTQRHSWGVSGESRSSKGLLQKKSPERVTMVVLWCKRGTVRALPSRNRKAGFRAPASQGTGLEPGWLARWVAAGGVHLGPRALPPRFSPTVPFLGVQQERRPSLRDWQNVLAVGVAREARGAEGTPVQDPVQNLFAAFAVLVSQ